MHAHGDPDVASIVTVARLRLSEREKEREGGAEQGGSAMLPVQATRMLCCWVLVLASALQVTAGQLAHVEQLAKRDSAHGPGWRRGWDRAHSSTRSLPAAEATARLPGRVDERSQVTPECEATLLNLCGRRSDYDTVKECYECGNRRILENFTKRHCNVHTTSDCCNNTMPHCTQGNCSASETHTWCLHPPPKPPPPCPAHLKAQVDMTGLLPVSMFNDSYKSTADGYVYHDEAVRSAINATKLCGGAVFFGPGTRWQLNSTVVIDDSHGLELRGAGGGSAQFQTGEQPEIHGPAHGPAFLLNGSKGFVEKVWFANLAIIGRGTGVKIFNGALIRFTNVMITVSANIDGVNTTEDGCDSCNVVLGSDNAALVAEDTFWLWAEDSSFIFEPKASGGQRPPVILRGIDKDGIHGDDPESNITGRGVNTVYLVTFDRVVFAGGGVQYQNVAVANQWPGWFTFNWCVMENSALPLLDVQGQPGKPFMGVQSVIINDCQSADASHPHYVAKEHQGVARFKGGNYVPMVGLNATDSRLDGITMTSFTTTENHAPAIRVYSGTVESVSIFAGQLVGGYDCVDANDVPIGAFVTRSLGGFAIVNKPPANATGNIGSVATHETTHALHDEFLNDSVVSGNSSHALIFGHSGERYARLAIDADGSIRYGDGASSGFHTVLQGPLSNKTTWNPPVVQPGGFTMTTVPVAGCITGDMVSASLSTMGLHPLVLSAHVSENGRVAVLLRHVGNENLGDTAIDIEEGTLRVLVTRLS